METSAPNNASSQARAVRLASIITAANVLIASGFSTAGLIAPASLLPASAAPGEASFIFALYAAARTLPLALVTLAAIYKRSAIALLALGVLAGLVQLVDAAIGLYLHDIGKTIGPLILVALQSYAVYRLEKSLRSGVV
jgi:hypothetical protein